ncbi:hypothetical protein T12_379 [Trichinella patagoniensis]|uniref:Uncharacterized protein n=1 Tax=Trichinella patagoniensis TaxID=990121 RepID=A0A0V0ZTX4_9BILA|nr:hypothetical protein T12_379 [Trichinella patagoniensis]
MNILFLRAYDDYFHKYKILSYNECKCKDFYEKHIFGHLDFYVIGHPVSYVILKNIPFYCKNHYSKQTNKANTAVNNSSDVKGTNSLKTKRLDPQYFQLGFGKRFIVNDENYPTNMQCCAQLQLLAAMEDGF